MKAWDVAKWLKTLEGVSQVVPVRVRLHDPKTQEATAMFDGAAYIQRDTARIYLLGEHPATYKKKGKLREKQYVCYTIEGDARDWYVAGYWPPLNADETMRDKFKIFHPCGDNFLLTPWEVEGSKIDDHDQQFSRVKITVEVLNEGSL